VTDARGAILVSDAVEARWSRELERAAPGLERRVLREGEAMPGPAGIEIYYFSGDLYPERMREAAIAALKARDLRWMHSFSAGVDDPFFRILLDRGVRLTTSSGAQAVPIAHTVMLYLLALTRDLAGWLRDQAERRWAPRNIGDLQGRTLGVIGLGPIGMEVARLGAAFGMNVIGVRREPRGDEPCETWPLDRLDDLWPRVDAVVLAVPLTDETRHMVDARALGRMKPGALLVNVARGGVVDEGALIDALRSGALGGAGLDVFEQEPLAPESPLWAMPNVIVTPHSSGSNPGNTDRASAIFLENLERYLRGDALRNEIRLDSTSA
jgi:phosphoglycerate dehydrogenase-like enzyme